jgi:hypothetical protein
MNRNSRYNFFDKPFDEKVLFFISLAIIFLYFLPYIILGRDASILIHDNLDSSLTWVKILLDSDEIFSSPDAHINQVFNGLPRSSLWGTYDIGLIWFKIAGMYWGYVINKFLMTIVGFFGMYYVLKRHFLPADAYKIIPFGVALIFALLPFWSFTMTICGLPLLLFAFLNIRNNQYLSVSWIIIIVFPLYSSLILSGVFFLLIMTMILIYDTVVERKINYKFLMALVVISIIYVLSHFPLFFSFVYSSEYISQRVEFQFPTISFVSASLDAFKMFKSGQYHAPSLHTFILLPIFLGLYLILRSNKINKRFILILLFIFLTSILYGFLDWNIIGAFKKQMMSFIPLKLERFHFLHPMFWYILLGISLFLISKQFKFGKHIVVLILILQFFYVLSNHEVITNRYKPSFKKFYAVDLFNDIKSFIGLPQDTYRVISVGIHPAIAQYNGFYTLDGYFPDYPLIYKHKFRKIISSELNKSPNIQESFDHWGARCYAFSSELGKDFLNPKPKQIENLEFDFNAFKQMGGKFIISSAQIVNNSNLKLLKEFKHTNSFWTIYLYQVL